NILEKENNHLDVVVIDNLSNAYKEAGEKKPAPLKIIEELTNKKIHFYDVDITDLAALTKHDIYCVIHFAALKAVGESVERPLDSSCTVYGEPETLPINEGHPTGRGLTSPYGKSKYFCEEIMKDLCTSDKDAGRRRYEGHRTGCGLTSPYGKSKYFCEEIMKDLCTSDKVRKATRTQEKWQVVSLRYFNPGHCKALQLFSNKGFQGFHAVNLGQSLHEYDTISPGHSGGATSRRHQQNVYSYIESYSPGVRLVALPIWRRDQLR
ncbi:UDP-glucose 4-epimerase, partial [Operophtera brumata]